MDNSNEEEFFNLVHDARLHPEVAPIKVRNAKEEDFRNNSLAGTLQKQLCLAFKDDNTACVKQMVADSNKDCLSTAYAALNYKELYHKLQGAPCGCRGQPCFKDLPQ